MSMEAKTTVLVVDDSALVREVLCEILSSDPALCVLGAAHDVESAREKIKVLNPNVVTLDIEMPGMNGLEFLKRIMRLRPTPVVMVSTLTQKDAPKSLEALRLGAIDCVGKPSTNSAVELAALKEELLTKVKVAAHAAPKVRQRQMERVLQPQQGASEKKVLAMRPGDVNLVDVVAVGASTGGVEALEEVIFALPPDSPPMVVVQHMPPGFTASLAQRLCKSSAVQVLEAPHNQILEKGHVYIAPGCKHLVVRRRGDKIFTGLQEGLPVSGHMPSVDILFKSVADAVGDRGVGVILTGMGTDGAKGLKLMRDMGAQTLGQDEASSLVYGMPKAAFEARAVTRQVPLKYMTKSILRLCGWVDGPSLHTPRSRPCEPQSKT